MLADYDFALIDGLRIHHRLRTRSDAPKLLLTGAWPQSIHGWEQAFEPLSEHFSLLALDLPGFGRSEGRRAFMSPSAQGTFLRVVLSHFGFVGAYAVMPDVGVPIGLWVLENDPTLLLGALFANGPCAYPLRASPALRLLAESAVARASLALTPQTFVRTAQRLGHRSYKPSAAILATYVDCYPADRLAATFAYLASYRKELPPIFAALPTINAPVSVLWGRGDPFLHESNARLIAERVPASTLELLDGVGHLSHEDAPQRFVDLLVRGHERAA